MSDLVAIENGAGISRVTCGWKLPHLSLAAVRPYWRDAHSPAIARRDGLYEHRHYPERGDRRRWTRYAPTCSPPSRGSTWREGLTSS